MEISKKTINDKWRHKIMELSGQNIYKCMQCGTCSGSCPMNIHIEASPRNLMALIQFGQSEKVSSANTAWVCASCHMCVVRCTRGIDLPKVMEAIRQVKLRTNENKVEPSSIEKEKFNELPQIAMVAGFRKFTS